MANFMSNNFTTEKRNEIERVFNCFPISDEVIKDMTVKTHPTIQANVLRFCYDMVRACAQKKNYDDRNEAPIKIAQALWNNPEARQALERPVPYI